MRPTPWPAVACLALVPALAWASDQPVVREPEGDLADHIQGWPGSDRDWDAASAPGHTLVALAVVAVTAALCHAWRERLAAALCLVGPTVRLAVEGLKALFQRMRPEEALAEGYAYPSGHAAMAMVAYGLVAVLLAPAAVRRFGPRWGWLAPGAIGLWLGLAFGVGFARVAASQHWPLDVAGGWSLGGAAVAAAWWAHRRWGPPAARPAPA